MRKHPVKKAVVGASETMKTTVCRDPHPGSIKDVTAGTLYARSCKLRRLQNHERSALSEAAIESQDDTRSPSWTLHEGTTKLKVVSDLTLDRRIRSASLIVDDLNSKVVRRGSSEMVRMAEGLASLIMVMTECLLMDILWRLGQSFGSEAKNGKW